MMLLEARDQTSVGQLIPCYRPCLLKDTEIDTGGPQPRGVVGLRPGLVIQLFAMLATGG